MKHFIYALLNSFFGTRRLNHILIPLAIFLFSTLGMNAQLVNIPVTGFTNDIVANGTGPGTPGSMPGVTYPTIGFDGGFPAASSFIDNTFKWQAANLLPQCFMPISKLVASARTSGLTYQLQDYGTSAVNNNNALTIDNNTTTYPSPFPNTGTLTLATPANYTSLFVLYEAAVNVSPLNVDVTVTFTDATTQVFSGITLQNWNFFNPNVAFGGGISRAQNISPGNPGDCASSTAPFLFEMSLVLNAQNLVKQVQSVSFSIPTLLTSGTGSSNVNYFHALALGGRVPCGPPMSGSFSIDNTQLTGGTNFSSFVEFSTALTCRGVNGPVLATVGGNTAFNEQVEFFQVPGASATNTITIDGNGKRITKTVTVALVPNYATINMNGASYFTVTNLQIDALGAALGFGVHLMNNASFNTFSNCTIKTLLTANANGTVAPVGISGSATQLSTPGINGSNNTFTGCTVSGGRIGFAFTGDGANFLNNQNNNIINCTIRDWETFGISITNGLGNCTFSGNIIERPFRTAIGSSCLPIAVSGSGNGISKGIVIEKNKIRNLFGANATTLASTISVTVIQVQNQLSSAGFENIIRGNLISDIIYQGNPRAIDVTGSSFIEISHNTIVFDQPVMTGTTHQTFGITTANFTAGLPNVSVLNNIIKINRGTGTTGQQILLQYASSGLPVNSNYNDLVITPGTNHFIGAAVTNQTTLAGWKAANPTMDQASVSVEPAFVNTAIGNYQPTATAINNIGIPVGALTDITNAPRSTTSPDPGAYEFTPSGTDALIQWVSPVIPAASGSQSVTVRIVNTMSVTITDVNLTYSLNSVDQQTSSFTGLNIPAGGSALCTFTLPFTLASSSNLAARINTVNGAADAISTNNATSYFICPALSGAYTINPAGAGSTNFTTFNLFNAALGCGGVAGPVTVTVSPANYNEQVEFKPVIGSSSTNTITINGNDASYSGTATAASSGTTITVNSTANLQAGMTVAVIGGTGLFTGTATVATITDATHFVVNTAPLPALAIGDVITGHTTTLTFVGTTVLPGTLNLNGADNMIFNNLNVVGTSAVAQAAIACHLYNQADNNTFLGCTFTVPANMVATNGHVPFSISGSVISATTTGLAGNNNTVTGCTMNSGQYGITLFGSGSSSPAIGDVSTGNSVKNCIFLDQAVNSIRLSNLNGTLISGNILERPNRTLFGSTYVGIEFPGACFNTLVDKNAIRKTWEKATSATTGSTTGITLGANASQGNENIFTNNVISDVSANTTAATTFNGGMVGFSGAFTSFYKFYHNTISFDNPLATGSTVQSTGISTGNNAIANIDIRNNIVSIKRTGTAAASFCIQYTSAIPTTSNFQSNYNDLYTSPSPTHFLGSNAGVSYATLAAWKAALPNLDQNSVSVNPRFVGPSSGDFTPSAGAINNIGLPLGVAKDFLGNTRGALPDPGAFEFSPPLIDALLTWVSPSTPPVTAGPNSITVNVLNNGLNTITDLKLRYTDGTVVVDQPFSGLTLTSGMNQNFIFTTPYNLASSVTLTASVQEVNLTVGDADATNDVASQSLCVPLVGTYTIGTGGNFTTFGAAVTQLASCGISGPVIFNVLSGTYTEQVEIPAIPGTSAVNTITVNGNNNTLTFNGAASSFVTLRLNGADYMIWNGLNIASTGTTNGIACMLSNASDNNQFNTCIFTCQQAGASTVSNGVLALASNATQVETAGMNGSNNTFTNCQFLGGYTSVTVNGSGQNNALPNNITNNKFIGCTMKDFFIHGVRNLNGAKGTVVSRCILERPLRTNLSTGTTIAIHLRTGSESILIDGNMIRNLYGSLQASSASVAGIEFEATTGSAAVGNVIINNILSNIGSNQNRQQAIHAIGGTNYKIYHNSIYFNYPAYTSTNPVTGIAYEFGNSGIDIQNNIVSMNFGGSATGDKVGIACSNGITGLSNLNYNDYHINVTGSSLGYVGVNGSNKFATIAAWKTALAALVPTAPGGEQQSLQVNPLFINPAGNDFTPNYYLLDNTANPLGVTTDFNGNPRSLTAPDFGAIEATMATSTDFTPVSLVSPGTSGCYSNAENIVVRIRNLGNATHDFASANVTVTCIVTGPAAGTFTTTLSTGTLASKATLDVPLSGTLNMSAVGTYSFAISTSVVSPGVDANTGNDILPAVTRSSAIQVAGIVSSNRTELCAGKPTLTLTGSAGGSIQWRESNISASGPFNNVGTGDITYTPAADITQTMYYTAQVTCVANTVNANVQTVSFNANPQLLSSSGASRCGVGPVTLNATSNALSYINWYDSPNASNPVFIGPSYAIPSLSSTATYYVSASFGVRADTVGLKVPPEFPTNQFSQAGYGLIFDALKPFKIGTVDLYAGAGANGTAGTVNIALKNSVGTIIAQKIVNVTGYLAPLTVERKSTVDLGFNVPAGTGYQLVTTSVAGINGLQYQTSAALGVPINYYAAPFNFSVNGVMTLVSGLVETPNFFYYPFFFNINVITGCETARQAVNANFTAAPSITAATSNGLICPGTSTQLSIATTGNPAYTYTWTPGNLTGTPVSVTPPLSTVYTVTANDNTAGPFAGCQTTTTVAVNTKPKVSIVTSANPLSVCSGGNSQLTAAGSTSFSYAMSQVTPSPVATPGGGVTILDKNNLTGNTGGLNDGYFTVNLPFPFDYFGTSFGQVYMNTNGFVSFGQGYSSLASSAQTIIPHTGDVNNAIYLAWKDWDMTNTGSIQYFTVGNAPHRIFVIKYTGMTGQPSSTGTPLNGQVELYEDNGKIELFLAQTDQLTYLSAPGATAPIGFNQIVTIASTVGLVPGMTLTVPGNLNGTFGNGATVVSVTDATHFVASQITVALTGAVVSATGTFNIDKTLGIENAAGITAFSPSARNGDGWSIPSPEQWEFMPFGGNLSYAWTPAVFLDDPNIAAPFASFIFNTTTYTASVSDAFTGCSASTTVTVATGDPLTAAPSANNPVICAGQTAIITANPSGGCAPYHYLWTEGPNTLGSSSFISVTPGQTTTYDLVVTDDVGTEFSSSVTVTVNPLPVVTSTQGLICGSGTATLTASGAATYTWAPATNLSATTGATVVSSSPVTVTYTVTGTSALGCTNTAFATVTRSYATAVTASATLTAIPVGGSTQLNASASELRPATTYYTLNSFTSQPTTYATLTGPGITVINTDAQLTPGFASGNQNDGGVLINLPFTFKYFGNNYTQMSMCTNGWVGAGNWSTIEAVNSSATNFFFTSSIPNATIAPWFKEMGANFPVGAGSMRHGLIGPDVYAFQWDKSNPNTTADGSAAVISFQVNIYGPSSGSPGRIEFKYGPNVGAQFFNAAVGLEDAIGGTDHYLNALNNSSSVDTRSSSWPGDGRVYEFNPNIVNFTYSWSPSTFLNNTLISNPTASNMTASTTYAVTATNADGCSSNGSVLIEVGVPLSATATSSGNNFCELLSNTLQANVHGGCQPYTYSWSNGTSVVGTTKDVVFAPPAGINTYTLTVTDVCGGTATSTVTVTVKPAPNTAVTKSGNICGGTPATLTATGATTYQWSPATGLNSLTAAVVTTTTGSAITYTVVGTGNNGCSRPASIDVGVFPAVIANPTATPSTICINGTSQLLANGSTDAGYSVASIAHQAIAPVSPTTVPFVGTDEAVVANIPLPFPINFFGISYSTWSISTNGFIGFGAMGSTPTSQFIPNTFTPNNLIALCWADLNVNTALGSSVTYFTSGIAPNRVFVISFNSVKFTSSNVGNVTGQIQLYEGTDVVEIHLTTVDHAGANSLNSLGIENTTGTVGYSAPNRNRNVNWDVTTPEAWRFAPLVPPFVYNWSPATFLNASNINNPTASGVTGSITYTATVTNSVSNCFATGTVTVTAGVPLVSSASVMTPSTCAGDEDSLFAAASGGKAPYSYSWSDGTSVVGTAQRIAVNPVVTTNYTLTVTDFCGVTSTSPVTIQVKPLPVLTVTPAGGSICNGSPSTITMTASGANSYSWNPPVGLNTTIGATVIAGSTGNVATTIYTVTGTSSLTGCFNTKTATVYRNTSVSAIASATPSQVCASQSSQLNSSFSVRTNPALLITEVTQFGAGSQGATSPRPGYFGATDDDFVEISNLSANPLVVGGLTFELWIGTGLDRSYIIPVGTILQGHSVLVLHIGTGSNSTANNFFNTLGSNNPLVSSIGYGYVLKSAGSILDAVATTASDGSPYAWPIASNVIASGAWSGTITYNSNSCAGAIRVGGFDSNTASDWEYSTNSNRQNLGSYNNCYGSNSQPAFTYAWSPAANMSDATLQNPVASGFTGGIQNITVTATDPASGCSSNASTTLTVTPLPTVTLSGPSTACAGTGITLNFAFTGLGPWVYSYTDGTTVFGPFTSNTISATASATPQGAAGDVVTYTPTYVSDSRCNGTASSLLGSAAVTLSSSSSIDGISLTSNKPFNNICVGDNITISMNGVTASSLGTGAHWKWYTGTCGGTPVAGSTDLLSITVNPSVTTTYFVRAEGACGTTNCVSLQVVVTSASPSGNPGVAYAPLIAYAGATDSLVVNPVPGATFYHWSTNGNSNILFDGHPAPYESSSNKVMVTFVSPATSGNGIGNYHIQFFAGNACGTTNSNNIHIRATVDAPTSVTGPLVVCTGSGAKTYTVSAVVGAKSYQWSIGGGGAGTIIGNGTQTVSVTFTTLPATLCVHGVSAFGSAGPDLCLNIITVTDAPGLISGNAAPCQGGSAVYSIADVTGAASNGYVWTTDIIGATVISNGTTSATVNFPGGAFSGNVCVTANSGCATSAPSCLPVAAGTTPQLGAITGITEGVCSATGMNYQVSSIGASSYTWNVPAGATITAGQGGNSILVDFSSNFTNGNITVVANSLCGSTPSLPLTVTGKPTVPIISGPAAVCSTDVEQYIATSVGATGYIWSIDELEGTILFNTNPNEIMLAWLTSGGTLSVTATNSCGSATNQLVVASNCRIAGSSSMIDVMNAMAFPNPSQGKLTLQYNSPDESGYLMKVTDLTGRLLVSETLKAYEGLNRHEINLSNVAKGVYMLSLENAGGDKIVIRLVIE